MAVKPVISKALRKYALSDAARPASGDSEMYKKAYPKKMKRIPIKAAREIAEKYGYDQVIIYARKVGENPDPNGEHMTTYGVTKEHCSVAARMGDFLKYKIFCWPKE